MFEQLALYTTRYQECDLHFGLYYSLTSTNNLSLPTLVTLFYFSTLLYFYSTSPTSSSIVAVLIAKAGHVWVS